MNSFGPATRKDFGVGLSFEVSGKFMVLNRINQNLTVKQRCVLLDESLYRSYNVNRAIFNQVFCIENRDTKTLIPNDYGPDPICLTHSVY